MEGRKSHYHNKQYHKKSQKQICYVHLCLVKIVQRIPQKYNIATTGHLHNFHAHQSLPHASLTPPVNNELRKSSASCGGIAMMTSSLHGSYCWYLMFGLPPQHNYRLASGQQTVFSTSLNSLLLQVCCCIHFKVAPNLCHLDFWLQEAFDTQRCSTHWKKWLWPLTKKT